MGFSSGPAARSLRLGTHQKPCGFNGVFSHPGAPIFFIVLDGMVPAIFMGFYDILLGFIWVKHDMLLGSCFFGTFCGFLNGVFFGFFHETLMDFSP